jgi:hypothetical protein
LAKLVMASRVAKAAATAVGDGEKDKTSATYDLTPSDAGSLIADAPGAITAIQVPSARGTSGRLSLTDSALNAQRRIWQPIIFIGVDFPSPAALAYSNPNSTVQPQLNLCGGPDCG